MGSRVKVPVSFCYLVPSIILEGLVWRTNSQLSQSISLQYINLYISLICFNSWHSSVLPHFSLTNKQYVTCNPAGNYMFKAINRNTGTRYEICWELTIKTPWTYFTLFSSVYIFDFEQIFASWEVLSFEEECQRKSTCLWRLLITFGRNEGHKGGHFDDFFNVG